MSNQCYGCAARFKRFHKPEDCMKCHRMFCSNCLQSLPSDNTLGSAKKTKSKICFNCLRTGKNILKKQQEAETLENLEKKYKQVASEQSVKSSQRARVREDENLERRLDELKGTPKTTTIPSVQALQQRLDKLKATEDDHKTNKDKATGQDKPSPGSVKRSPLPTRKTAEEETHDLMKQTADEVNIELTQDTELGQRLHNLKTGGQTLPSVNAQVTANTDVSTDQLRSGENNCKEVQNLIKYTMEENKLEEQRRQETEAFIANCEARLQKLTNDANVATKYSEEVRSKLRAEDSSLQHGYSLDLSEEYLDEEVQNLVEQFAAEVELDKKSEHYFGNVEYGHTDTPEIPKPRPADELPWCCICNDDATLRCCDCDDDLYCERCFREGHQQFQLFNHIYIAYTKPGQTAASASNK